MVDGYDQLESYISKKKKENTQKPDNKKQISKSEKSVPLISNITKKISKSKESADAEETTEFERSIDEDAPKKSKKSSQNPDLDLMNIPKSKVQPKQPIKTKSKEPEEELFDDVDNNKTIINTNDLDEDDESNDESDDMATDEPDDMATDDPDDDIKKLSSNAYDLFEDDNIEIKKNMFKKEINDFREEQQTKIDSKKFEQEIQTLKQYIRKQNSTIESLKERNSQLESHLQQYETKLEKYVTKFKEIEQKNNQQPPQEPPSKKNIKQQTQQNKPQKQPGKVKQVIYYVMILFLVAIGFWFTTTPTMLNSLPYTLQIGIVLMIAGVALFIGNKT